MQLNQLREELLLQHAALRELIAQVAALNQPGQTGADTRNALLAKLATALSEHNQFEETALRGVIVKLDAWGPQREALMDQHHAQEHECAFRALEQLGQVGSDEERTLRLQQHLSALLEHMRLEEREVLHPNVLRDDATTADPFGG